MCRLICCDVKSHLHLDAAPVRPSHQPEPADAWAAGRVDLDRTGEGTGGADSARAAGRPGRGRTAAATGHRHRHRPPPSTAATARCPLRPLRRSTRATAPRRLARAAGVSWLPVTCAAVGAPGTDLSPGAGLLRRPASPRDRCAAAADDTQYGGSVSGGSGLTDGRPLRQPIAAIAASCCYRADGRPRAYPAGNRLHHGLCSVTGGGPGATDAASLAGRSFTRCPRASRRRARGAGHASHLWPLRWPTLPSGAGAPSDRRGKVRGHAAPRPSGYISRPRRA